MDELYNQKERYNKYFLEIIEDLKKARPTKDYKELKFIHTPEAYQLLYAISSSYRFIEDYKFSEIEFICFTFYYIFKYKDRNNDYNVFDDLYYFFDNLSIIKKPNYLKYIKIFIFILTYKIILDQITNMVYLLIEYKNNYELYLEYLHNLFFYGFFFIDDINEKLICNIKNGITRSITDIDKDKDKDKDIIIKYMQPLDNILSWSKMREIWICLCIFAQPKKYIISYFDNI